jgi:hypothetical protein
LRSLQIATKENAWENLASAALLRAHAGKHRERRPRTKMLKTQGGSFEHLGRKPVKTPLDIFRVAAKAPPTRAVGRHIDCSIDQTVGGLGVFASLGWKKGALIMLRTTIPTRFAGGICCLSLFLLGAVIAVVGDTTSAQVVIEPVPEQPVVVQPIPGATVEIVQLAQPAPSAQGQPPTPVVDVPGLMRLFNGPLYKSLKKNMAQEPAGEQQWSEIEANGLQAAEIANLVALRRVPDAQAEVMRGADDLQRAGTALADAAKAHQWNAAQQAYRGVVQACNNCHQTLAPGEAPQLRP